MRENTSKIAYSKKVMNIDGFIERIKSKGFFIGDIDFVKDFLNKNGY